MNLDSAMTSKSGAYLLHLLVPCSLKLTVGALGEVDLPAGRYIYVGSARKGLEARIARHILLSRRKGGKVHWHVDHLLIHPEIKLVCAEAFPGEKECELSRRISLRKNANVPVLRFGAGDCRSGCPAHLYRMTVDLEGEHNPDPLDRPSPMRRLRS